MMIFRIKANSLYRAMAGGGWGKPLSSFLFFPIPTKPAAKKESLLEAYINWFDFNEIKSI